MSRLMSASTAVALLLGLAAMGPAAAQQPTQQEMSACMGDFQKLCEGVQPGGGRVLACLSQNKDKLTPACKAVVDKHGG